MSDTRLSPISLVAEIDDLAALHRYVADCASRLGIDQDLAYDIDLAINELAANSLMHGYPKRSGWIEVEIQRQAAEFVVWVRDRAPAFDPTLVAPPDLRRPLELRGLGGMGIHLIRQMTTQMVHRLLPGGGNEIELHFLPKE